MYLLIHLILASIKYINFNRLLQPENSYNFQVKVQWK